MWVAFDTETYLIAPGRLAPKLVCLSYCTDKNESGVISDRYTIKRTVMDWLERKQVMVGANVAFDMGVLCQAFPELIQPVFRAYRHNRVRDIQLDERLHLIARGALATRGGVMYDGETGERTSFSLADLVKKHLNEEVEGKHGPDVWRLRYHELDGVPMSEWPWDAKRYAELDACYTARVYQAQSHREMVPENSGFEARAAWALHLMSAWGVRTNAAQVSEFAHRLQEHIDDALQSLVPTGMVDASGSKKTKVIRARVEKAYAEMGREAPRTEPSTKFPEGQVSISEEVLFESGDEDLVLLASIAKDQHELNTWVPALQQGTQHPINARYNPILESDRTSCTKPNLQNPPRRAGVRECFEPRPGHVFVSVDYSVAELRALAQNLVDLFGESKLADSLRAGKDPHLVMAANILGMDYDDAVLDKRSARVKEARQLAKAANFGFPGGLGAESFIEFARGYDVHLSMDAARQLKEKWLQTYPEMRQYFQYMGRLTEAGGGKAVITHPRTGFTRGGVGYCDGCNHNFQHLVARGAKSALFEVAEASYANEGHELYGFRPVLFLHDEIIGEAPEGQLNEMANALARVMVDALAEYCPDVPVIAEPAAMRRWYKGAELVLRDGRIIPWEP